MPSVNKTGFVLLIVYNSLFLQTYQNHKICRHHLNHASVIIAAANLCHALIIHVYYASLQYKYAN